MKRDSMNVCRSGRPPFPNKIFLFITADYIHQSAFFLSNSPITLIQFASIL